MDKKGYRIDHVRISPDKQIEYHSQKTWELSFVVLGEGERVIGDDISEFKSGDLVFIPPEISHKWTFGNDVLDPEGMIENITIIIEHEWLERCLASFPELAVHIGTILQNDCAITFYEEQYNRIVLLMKHLCQCDDFDRLITMLKLLREIADSNQAKVVTQRKISDSIAERINKINIYIICNFRNSIPLEEIARYVGMSQTSFCAFFKKHFGMSFVNYLNRTRLEAAKEMLKETSLSISEIAFRSGFNSIPYFNRVFRNASGMSPGEYRVAGCIK